MHVHSSLLGRLNQKTAIYGRKNVLCNNNIDLSGLCPCNHEEADTRLFVHLKHTAIQGLKTSLVVSTDTDVVLAISMFEKLEIDKLWIAFGKGKDLRWIPIHEISMHLLVVTQYQPFVEKVSEQHGRYGKSLMMRQIRLFV